MPNHVNRKFHPCIFRPFQRAQAALLCAVGLLFCAGLPASAQELSNAEALLNEIAWPGLVKCVKGGQANFDANWDAMVAELEANGLKETEKKMTEFLADKIQ